MFKPEPPQPSPYVHRVVPMFLFRRIVRPDGNAQKSMTAPENKRRPNVAKGATHPSSWVTRSIASSERKADRGRSTPCRRLLGERHPEPRARVRPVRLKLSSRQADDPLLRLQFAIIIARGNLRPCRGQSDVPVFGLLLPDRTGMVCIWRKTSHRERGSGR